MSFRYRKIILKDVCSDKKNVEFSYAATENINAVLRKLLFWLHYTAENSHHLKARIISKDPLFQEEKIPARKQDRCQVNSEKSSNN
jgi:hypothetical protein